MFKKKRSDVLRQCIYIQRIVDYCMIESGEDKIFFLRLNFVNPFIHNKLIILFLSKYIALHHNNIYTKYTQLCVCVIRNYLLVKFCILSSNL